MNELECWYHYFCDRQACNNYAAYLFLAHIGSILTKYGFGAGCYPPRRSSSVVIVAVENSQRTKARNSNRRVRHEQLTAIFREANRCVNQACYPSFRRCKSATSEGITFRKPDYLGSIDLTNCCTGCGRAGTKVFLKPLTSNTRHKIPTATVKKNNAPKKLNTVDRKPLSLFFGGVICFMRYTAGS